MLNDSYVRGWMDVDVSTGRGKMPVGCGLHVGGAVGDEGAGVGAAESES